MLPLLPNQEDISRNSKSPDNLDRLPVFLFLMRVHTNANKVTPVVDIRHRKLLTIFFSPLSYLLPGNTIFLTKLQNCGCKALKDKTNRPNQMHESPTEIEVASPN